MRPVIGHTIFFTNEKKSYPFSRLLTQLPKVGMFTTFAASPESIMVSRFADIVSVKQFIKDQENENTKKKTQQNVALLKKFLTLKNESRLMVEIPPKELNAYISEFIVTVQKKDNNKDYEPSSLHSLMASFERYLKKKNSTFLSKALINLQPQPLQKLR